MNSFYTIRGPLCRSLPIRRPSRIFSRCVFTGRTKSTEQPKSRQLPDTPARTRFAPSPTGYLHLGSLRTALYNYLLAKATGGQFILRIEDTDRSRIVPDAEERLYEDLKWAGLHWDEGPDIGGPYSPYRQSEFLPSYNQYATQLLDEKKAYRCFCTHEQLDELRSISVREGKPVVYNRTCRRIPSDVSTQRAANGEPHCVRFKCIRRPKAKNVINDLVYGPTHSPSLQDDFILIKQDGYPTYHFANVIDDHRMKITHVIRGAEWLISTNKHNAIYDAFGWTPPAFAHVGLLTNNAGGKLSKRESDIGISSWRKRGILPASLLNYLVVLGWSIGRGVKGQDQVMDVDEMISKFHLGFTKGDIKVNDKDGFLQRAHVKRLIDKSGPSSLSSVVLPWAEARFWEYENKRKIETLPDTDPDSFTSWLGPPIPLLAQDGIDEAVAYRDRINEVIKIDPYNFKYSNSFLMRNRFLLWQVPEALFRSTWAKKMAGAELRLVDRTKSPSTELSDPPQIKPVLVSEIISQLRNALEKVDDKDWELLKIHSAVKSIIESVFLVSPETGDLESKHWGYILLRWVITAAVPGPELILAIAAVGKDETLRRMDTACKVAQSMEKDGKPEIESE
ncbi:hypothetical protein F4804DRAFT_340636 [Jackrogersella minutella]|nr:hypothetical protein F4804DRAFT_340636 [Jackrogersella minutella]